VFTADTSLVSYVPKKGKHVVLASMLNRDGEFYLKKKNSTFI
jgi:hypothetical protein